MATGKLYGYDVALPFCIAGFISGNCDITRLASSTNFGWLAIALTETTFPFSLTLNAILILCTPVKPTLPAISLLNLSDKNDVEKFGNEIGRVGKEIKSNRNKDLITKFFGIEDFEKKIGVVSHQKFDGRKPNCFVDSFLYYLCELCYEEENEKLILCIGSNPIGIDGYLERNWRRIGINQPIQYGNYR